MEISCKICIHKKVCDLWGKQECQNASNFFEDECELYIAEPKKGKWVRDENFDTYKGNAIYRCSVCGNDNSWGYLDLHNYCPNCGAKMEKPE